MPGPSGQSRRCLCQECLVLPGPFFAHLLVATPSLRSTTKAARPIVGKRIVKAAMVITPKSLELNIMVSPRTVAATGTEISTVWE